MDEATAGLSIVDETDKEIEQDEEYVEHMPNYNHDVVGQGTMYELVQQPNDSDYESIITVMMMIQMKYLIRLLVTNFGKKRLWT